MQQDIINGDNLIIALKKSKVFSRYIINVMESLPTTYSFEKCFALLSEEYIEKLLSLCYTGIKCIEPIILLLTTIIIGSIVIEVYLSILDIADFL